MFDFKDGKISRILIHCLEDLLVLQKGFILPLSSGSLVSLILSGWGDPRDIHPPSMLLLAFLGVSGGCVMEKREARALVRDSGIRLVAAGLTAGTWGNISVRVGGGFMAITPSGGEYATMTPEDIVIVNLADGTWDGGLPSSERELHIEIYRTRPEIAAVIHTHSPHASVVAAARREVPPVLDDLAQIIGPSVRCAPYALPGTEKIVRVTVKALRGRLAALMANHGAVCLGRDMEEAFTCCEVLEKGCKAFIEASFLGGAKPINRFEAAEMHRAYLEKYSRLRLDAGQTRRPGPRA